MTDVEKIMWYRLRGKRLEGFKFYRQFPIGYYILDFYCPSKKLAIELDGSQHMDRVQKDYDECRSKYLNNQGIRLLRFWNNEVNGNLDGVLEVILKELTSPTFQVPSPVRRGGKG